MSKTFPKYITARDNPKPALHGKLKRFGVNTETGFNGLEIAAGGFRRQIACLSIGPFTKAMRKISGRETSRLRMRQWGASDGDQFAALNADPGSWNFFLLR